MKRARDSQPLRVVIDCGGTKYTTFASTIQRSSYLGGMVDLDVDLSEIFVDRDPEIFKSLLRLMRQYPHISGLLPRDELECASLLTEADFFGFEGLLDIVKVRSYYNLRVASDDYPELANVVRNPGESHVDFRARITQAQRVHTERCASIDETFRSRDEAHALRGFAEKYGSISDALASGVLPSAFLKPPEAPPDESMKKILQVVPPDQPTWFLVGDMYDSKYGGPGDTEENPCPVMAPMERVLEQPGFVRRVAGHALVEGVRGQRWMEPLVLPDPADHQEWLSHQPQDGRIFLNATDRNGDLTEITGGAGRRMLLASDWLLHAVYNRHSLQGIERTKFWTHVLTTPHPSPPREWGFSNAEDSRSDEV